MQTGVISKSCRLGPPVLASRSPISTLTFTPFLSQSSNFWAALHLTSTSSAHVCERIKMASSVHTSGDQRESHLVLMSTSTWKPAMQSASQATLHDIPNPSPDTHLSSPYRKEQAERQHVALLAQCRNRTSCRQRRWIRLEMIFLQEEAQALLAAVSPRVL